MFSLFIDCSRIANHWVNLGLMNPLLAVFRTTIMDLKLALNLRISWFALLNWKRNVVEQVLILLSMYLTVTKNPMEISILIHSIEDGLKVVYCIIINHFIDQLFMEKNERRSSKWLQLLLQSAWDLFITVIAPSHLITRVPKLGEWLVEQFLSALWHQTLHQKTTSCTLSLPQGVYILEKYLKTTWFLIRLLENFLPQKSTWNLLEFCDGNIIL